MHGISTECMCDVYPMGKIALSPTLTGNHYHSFIAIISGAFIKNSILTTQL